MKKLLTGIVAGIILTAGLSMTSVTSQAGSLNDLPVHIFDEDLPSQH
ncbi:hypothetical protein [Halalkalibacillus halophilus]|nr:hypothetical protein [Halalkalibacillus halophilus]